MSPARLRLISLVWCFALAGCGGGEDAAAGESAGSGVPAAPAITDVAAEAAQRVGEGGELVSTLLREAGGGGEKSFELRVTAEGLELPVLEGSSIMATSIANLHTQYVFLVRGQPGSSVQMALRGGAKDEAGAHDPLSLTLLYAEPLVSCGYTTMGGRPEGTLAVTVAERTGGVRGEIAGDVVCRPMRGEGGPWKGRVEGWYER